MRGTEPFFVGAQVFEDASQTSRRPFPPANNAISPSSSFYLDAAISKRTRKRTFRTKRRQRNPFQRQNPIKPNKLYRVFCVSSVLLVATGPFKHTFKEAGRAEHRIHPQKLEPSHWRSD